VFVVAFCSFALFCTAVKARSTECVHLILEQDGVNVNCQNYINTSALHIAVTSGQPELTGLLLQYGARSDILEDMNITPVFSASQHGQTECLKLLLESLATSGIVVAVVAVAVVVNLWSSGFVSVQAMPRVGL